MPVRELEDWENPPGAMMCVHCGRRWDDSIPTSMTPAPSGRCPFEYEHEYEEDEKIMGLQNKYYFDDGSEGKFVEVSHTISGILITDERPGHSVVVPLSTAPKVISDMLRAFGPEERRAILRGAE